MMLICLPLLVACSSDDDNNIKEPSQGSDHSYDITINPGSANERHLKGTIKNSKNDDGTINNFSLYTNTANGKSVVLRLGNADILFSGLFFHDNNGHTTDLTNGYEDDSDEQSRLIITLSPPSQEAYNSIAGTVNISEINKGISTAEGGVMGYTLNFDGQFEDLEEQVVQIKGTVVVKIPNLL